MRIRYGKPASHPPLMKVKPHLSEYERSLARLDPPPALPVHCKPWTDANSYGLLMVFPYQARLVVTGYQNGPPGIRFEPTSDLPIPSDIVTVFAANHFGLATNYRIKTDPYTGIYINSLPDGYITQAEVVRGLVETWWYPRRLFIVLKVPPPGKTITLQHGDPLCMLMPVVCEPCVLEELTPLETSLMLLEQRQYEEYIACHPEIEWTSAEGRKFSHAYKVFSKKHGAGRKDER